MRLASALVMVLLLAVPARVGLAELAPATAASTTAEKWGIFELALHGPSGGNPFVDVTFSARFTCGDRTLRAQGFYDGDGVYRVRCMPDREGVWRYETASNRPELAGKTGEFTCTPAAAGNHGPVRVHDTFYFDYADGTAYHEIGTTCYGWVHQPRELQEQTLATLKASPFNKVRMCVLPTKLVKDEGAFLPFETTAPRKPDLARFNVRFFRLLEKRVGQLRDMGIQADIILFHPYGYKPYGFARMPAEADDRYLRYVVARLSAYRNVWWCMGNEYDLLREKKQSDWDRFFQIVQAEDPYGHLRSIHQNHRMYDDSKPWVTHVSAQNGSAVAELGRAPLYRELLQKPVVFDEVRYEGNMAKRWGNLSGEEMALRFWVGTIGGTYVGHGESLVVPGKPAWTGDGGVLRGESPARIAFLKKILEEGPAELEPIDRYYESDIAGVPGKYYLIYFAREKPTAWQFELYKEGLAAGMKFHVDVLDTWNMNVTPVAEPFTLVKHDAYTFHAEGERKVELPGRPYMALRLRRIDEAGASATEPATQQ